MGGNQTLALSQAPAPTDPIGDGSNGNGGTGDQGSNGGDNSSGDVSTGNNENDLGVTDVAARSLSNDRVQLSWKNTGLGTIKAVRIEIVSTVSRQVFKSVTISGNVVGAILTNLHPGWQLDFKVVAITATGEFAGKP